MTGTRVSRRFLRWTAGLALAALVLGSATARAQDPRARFSIAGQVGASSVSMKDVNDRINAGNAFLRRAGFKTMGQVGMNYNFTYDVRARLTGPFSVSVGGGKALGKSKAEFDHVFTVEPKTSFYQVLGLVKLPLRPVPSMILRLGAGPVYASGAKTIVRHEIRTVEGGTNRIETVTIEGKGLGARAFFEAEMVLNEKITLVADLGYRQLKIASDNWSWGVSVPKAQAADLDGDGIPNQWDLNDTEPKTPSGTDTPAWMTESFVEVQYGQNNRPQVDTEGRPLVRLRPGGSLDMDFSGVLANVGLRFHIF